MQELDDEDELEDSVAVRESKPRAYTNVMSMSAKQDQQLSFTDDIDELDAKLRGLSRSSLKDDCEKANPSRRTLQSGKISKYDSELPEFVTTEFDVANNPSQMDAASSQVSFQRLGLKSNTDGESTFERIMDQSE